MEAVAALGQITGDLTETLTEKLPHGLHAGLPGAMSPIGCVDGGGPAPTADFRFFRLDASLRTCPPCLPEPLTSVP